MQQKSHVSFAAAVLLGTTAYIGGASAAPVLLAAGNLSGSSHDMSTATSALLENSISGNLLGGMGSGFAWAGGDTFLALPDRGPNATSYDAKVDNTASYIDRFQTVTMTLTPNAGPGLPFTLTPTLTATTLLYSPTPLVYGTGAGLNLDSGKTLPANLGGGNTLPNGTPALNDASHSYFTGRSDNFDPSLPSSNPLNARLDPEGIRVSNDGKSVFISDEYGPYLRQFDRSTGQLIKTFALPGSLAVQNQSPVGANEGAPNNTSGRTNNKGMEGLAITPDGKTLVGMMQANLLQDPTGYLRIVKVDIATGVTHQYVYKLTDGSGVSEITAINDHEFLVDERDGRGIGGASNGGNNDARVKKIYKIDLNVATEVFDNSTQADITAAAVSKTQFIDVVALLTDPTGLALDPTQIPSKLEGLAFGHDILRNGVLYHTLFLSSDNDFDSNVPNNFYVFGVTDEDLARVNADFVAQDVPEPATLGLMGLGLAGLTVLRRRRR